MLCYTFLIFYMPFNKVIGGRKKYKYHLKNIEIIKGYEA